MRPLLLLDVDGVLSPTGNAVPPGFERRSTTTFSVVVRGEHGDWLRLLSDLYELVWATTWGASANEVYGAIYGLDEMPVMPLGDLPRAGTRKLAAVARYVGDRPLAWVDDELYDDAESWARARTAPTLLVRTHASVGLSKADVDRLTAFAAQSSSRANTASQASRFGTSPSPARGFGVQQRLLRRDAATQGRGAGH